LKRYIAKVTVWW